MQQVDETYNRLILEPGHFFEYSLTIGESGVLITERGDYLIFGAGADAVRILVDTGGPDSGFNDTQLIKLQTVSTVFPDSTPTAGNAIAAELDVEMLAPIATIPRRARVCPYVRVATESEHSGWIPQGVFFIDTREKDVTDKGLETLKFHCYDAMVFSDVDFPLQTSHDWPASGVADTVVLADIAAEMGVNVDPRTWDIMTSEYKFGLPAGYSCREILRMIAGSYCGNFVMTEAGELRLVQLFEMPPESSLLIDEDGNVLVFGEGDEEVRILV